MAANFWAGILAQLQARPDFKMSSLIEVKNHVDFRHSIVSFEYQTTDHDLPDRVEIYAGDNNSFWVRLVPHPVVYAHLRTHLNPIKSTRTGKIQWAYTTLDDDPAVQLAISITAPEQLNSAIDALLKELSFVDKVCRDTERQLSAALRADRITQGTRKSTND